MHHAALEEAEERPSRTPFSRGGCRNVHPQRSRGPRPEGARNRLSMDKSAPARGNLVGRGTLDQPMQV